MSNQKLVIVARHDLHMRLGKGMSQGGHAAEMFVWNLLAKGELPSPQDWEWFTNGRKKITLRVNSHEELLEVYLAARSAGLTVNMVTDSGKTEFHGEPTDTCFSIGPHEAERIDPITGHLKPL
jgi:PTH2 family peptidyl-tRNA hydrolase